MIRTGIARGFCGAILAAARVIAASADQSQAVESPVEPRDSLQHFVVAPELQVELAAHEPQVIDPVAIRFDEEGRMWVVEMRDYPTGPKPGESPRSRISLLEDRDGDGLFESAAVFADNLLFATGVQPWKGGAIVTLAGQVAYMKDTNGDGKADVRETWYTGFAQQNSQLRANHPQLALDNHVYVANGLRGGTVVDAAGHGQEPLSISGMDFRFNPLTYEFEAASGMGQFGLTFDDYGNRFVCSNRNPAVHIVLENRFLKQNPLVAAPAIAHDVARTGADSRLFPVARSWTTSNLHAGQFTAACGVEVYRGDALGPDYYGNIFVCEPTGHLIHREIMRPKGATFESTTPHLGVEFLASRDSWFSPVNLEVGPDGALYVVDMYRAVIEHPDWMPPELQHRPDQMDGSDRGRIYRVTLRATRRPLSTPKLSTLSNKQLVAELAAANAWRRETAARLLLERQDRSMEPLLRDTAVHHPSQLARIHALWLLRGLCARSADVIEQLLDDPDPRIVEQAIAAAEGQVCDDPQLRDKIGAHSGEQDARVRLMALLVARQFPRTVRSEDEWERVALLIAAGTRGGEAVAQTLRGLSPAAAPPSDIDDAQSLVVELARLAAASADNEQYVAAVECLLSSETYCRPGLAAFLAEATRRSRPPETVMSMLAEKSRQRLSEVFELARATAVNQNAPDAKRCECIELVALGRSGRELVKLALDDASQAVRLRALAGLVEMPDLSPWRQLLARFPHEEPAVRVAILEGVLARPERTSLLLDEFAAGRIKPAELGAMQLGLLLTHSDSGIKVRAHELAAAAVPADRQEVLTDYQSVLALRGDARRGRQVFEKHCAACHRVGGVGVNVGPDISDSRERTAAQYLTDILQPNRAIDANYFNYTAVTAGGLVHRGILTAESSTSITLQRADGTTVMLRRNEIDELRSSGVSLMPEGLEREIPMQEMADLIAFIKNWRYLDGATPLGDGP